MVLFFENEKNEFLCISCGDPSGPDEVFCHECREAIKMLLVEPLRSDQTAPDFKPGQFDN